MKTIFSHGLVITVDPERRIIEDGAVVVEGTRIIEIDKTEPILAKYGADAEIIDCQRKMILPGLVDVHGHAGHSMFIMLGYVTQTNWMPLLTHLYHHNTTDDFWYHEGRLAALTRMKYGTTCGLSVMTNCQRSDDPILGINHSNGYAEVGIREIVATGPSNPPFPRNITRVSSNGEKRETYLSFDDLMRGAEDTISAVHHSHDDLIRAVIAPFVLVTSVNPSTPTTPDVGTELDEHDKNMMRGVREIAKRQNTRIHTEAFGTMIQMVRDFPDALLGPDVHIQHCTGITTLETRILADSGTHVSSTADAMQLVQRCPVPELMDMGVNVAISSDGSSPCNTFDLVTVAQKTQLVHQAALRNSFYFPAGKLLEMITIDAAKAVGWDDEIGSLEVGKKADIITVDLNQPHLSPGSMSLRKWILMGSGKDVDNVMVNGKVVMRNRKATLVDEDEIMRTADRVSMETIQRGKVEEFLLPCDTFWGSTQMSLKKPRIVPNS